MAAKIDEVQRDIAEVESLLNQATRKKIKDVLGIELRKYQTELMRLKELFSNSEGDKSTPKPITTNVQPKVCNVKLNTYCWDESDKFFDIYVTLENVKSLPAESITCDFTKNSMELRVLGLQNKNYYLTIANLCEAIDPAKSSFKVKTNSVVIHMEKVKPQIWGCVTAFEKNQKKPTIPSGSTDVDQDPETGLMNLMKKMYNEGDDDMKRTIAKAWTQSQNARDGGMTPSLPAFPTNLN